MTEPDDLSSDGAPAAPGPWKSRLLGLLACAAAVIACEALVFRYLFQYGVSDIWYADGATQHFPALLYFHEWMTAVLNGRGGDFGLWSWRLGLGADTLTTLSYYLGDPFALISLLFPRSLLEYVYEGLFFLRILCAGLAAYLYMRTMRATRFAATAGTLVYVFASFALQATLKHPSFFANAMIFFPLILVGIERVFAGRRWYLLVGVLFVSAASNFYFFYQIAIVAVVYAIARYIEITPRHERLRRLLPDGGRIAGWFVLGTSLAAFTLVPLALALSTSSRAAGGYVLTPLYPLATYYTYIVALLSPISADNSFLGGFAVLGLLCSAVVLLRRGNIALKVMLGAFAISVVFPVFGIMFNGFTFPSYRFFFMAGLFFGASVASVLSAPRCLSRRELTVTGVGLAIFAAIEVWASLQIRRPLTWVVVPLVLAALTWLLFAAEAWMVSRAGSAQGGSSGRQLGRSTLFRTGVVIVLVVGIAASGVANFSKRYLPEINDYLPLGTALASYDDDPGTLAPSLPTEGLERIDKQKGAFRSDLESSHINDSLVQGFAGLDLYYSVSSGGVHEYLKGLGVRTKRFAHDYQGLDDRAALDLLNGVRYYIAPAEGTQFVPYGFTRSADLATATVHENRYTLPVGYVFHTVVPADAYAAMPPLDKQQALLQGVVLENDLAPSLARVRTATETIEVPYTLTPERGVKWDTAKKRVVIKKAGNGAELSFSAVPDAELYVEMRGIIFTGGRRLLMAAQSAGPRKVQSFLPEWSGYYWGGDTFLVNLGYFPNGATRARVSFLEKRGVSYTSLKVIAVPMRDFGERATRLAAEGMSDVRVGTDALSGTVTSQGDGVLFLSVPYSAGWSATVDGVPVSIVRANVGFSGIPVSGGTHRIELRYSTPGLRAGTIISLLALLLTAALVVATEIRRSASRSAPVS